MQEAESQDADDLYSMWVMNLPMKDPRAERLTSQRESTRPSAARELTMENLAELDFFLRETTRQHLDAIKGFS